MFAQQVPSGISVIINIWKIQSRDFSDKHFGKCKVLMVITIWKMESWDFDDKHLETQSRDASKHLDLANSQSWDDNKYW